MPGPNRRSLSQVGSTVDSFGPGEAHPFLTQRGLWLQQNGRVDLPQPIALPSASPGRGSRREGPIWVDGVPVDSLPKPESRAPLLGRFRGGPIDSQTLQNVRASTQYPDPSVLRSRPLTNLFQSSLASMESDSPTRVRQRRAIGKLVIHLPGDRPGQFASGSAWVTGPNTLMTCAHNLFDSNTRQWSMGLEFYPGYDFYDEQPSPACRVVSASLPRGYLDNPLTNHDMAICRVDRNIGDMIGTEIPMKSVDGIDFFDDHEIVISGYPAGSGFDFGKQLWQSRGEFLFGMSGGGGDDFAPALATNFGGGASGCPWLVHDVKRDRWVAVGVTSGHARLRYEPGEPNLMSLTSPLINEAAIDRINEDSVEHEFFG